jgi:hypothetical protein
MQADQPRQDNLLLIVLEIMYNSFACLFAHLAGCAQQESREQASGQAEASQLAQTQVLLTRLPDCLSSRLSQLSCKAGPSW